MPFLLVRDVNADNDGCDDDNFKKGKHFQGDLCSCQKVTDATRKRELMASGETRPGWSNGPQLKEKQCAVNSETV